MGIVLSDSLSSEIVNCHDFTLACTVVYLQFFQILQYPRVQFTFTADSSSSSITFSPPATPLLHQSPLTPLLKLHEEPTKSIKQANIVSGEKKLTVSTCQGKFGLFLLVERENMSACVSERSCRVSYSQRSMFSPQSHYITVLFKMKSSERALRSFRGKWLTCWLTSLKCPNTHTHSRV